MAELLRYVIGVKSWIVNGLGIKAVQLNIIQNQDLAMIV